MASNNSLNKASEALVVGPIGIAAPDSTSALLQVQRNIAGTVSATVANLTNDAASIASMQIFQQMSTGLGSAGIFLFNDASSSPGAGYFVIENSPNGAGSTDKGIYILLPKTTDKMYVAINAASPVTLAYWDTNGGQYRAYNTNTAPSAGFIGELLVATGTASLTINTITNISSITLTPGNWEVYAQNAFTWDTGVGITSIQGCIATANNNFTPIDGTASLGNGNFWITAAAATPTMNLGPCRVSISTNTTYYINAVLAGTSANAMASTSRLHAVRVG